MGMEATKIKTENTRAISLLMPKAALLRLALLASSLRPAAPMKGVMSSFSPYEAISAAGIDRIRESLDIAPAK